MTLDYESQQYEVVDIETLEQHPDNPRRGDVDALVESIDVNGFYGAVIVQRSTRRVLAGNHRLIAAREKSIARLPVIFIDVDDATARRIMLVDNRSSDLADYDDDALIDLLRTMEGDLTGTAFTDDDLLLLLSQADAAAAVNADDDMQQAQASYALFDRQQIIDQAFEHYRSRDFPYRDVPLHDQMQQLNRLAALDDAVLLHSDCAYHVADTYHPQRFAVPIRGKRTPLDSFHDDKRLRTSFELILDSRKQINDATLLQTLALVRGSQAAANFRPAFALLMYRRFAPPGAVVLDSSTGWGGRLLGYAASECSTYIGIDPNKQTHDNNLAMTKQLNIEGVELICEPAEDVDHDRLRDECDFAFTSPPYFAKERYSDDETQSCVRYPSGNEWRDGFLIPMLRLQYAALKSGAINVVNIADVTIDSRKYPLLDWTIDGAQEVGFSLMRVERFPMPRVPGQGEKMQRYEPLVILRKD